MATSHDRHPPAGTSVVTNVVSNLSVVTLLAANANRLGASVYNDGNSRCLVKLGAGASATSFTELVPARHSYEVPSGYTGIITAIWLTVVSGSARVTELRP